MTDYIKNEDYAAKDALLTGDAEKLILGTDLGGEFDEIQSTMATKYDSSDIATQAQAEAGASNAVLMTPLRVAQFLADSGGGGAGVVNDLIALTDPGADRILFWDDSAGAATWLTVGSTLAITATTLDVAAASTDHDALLNFVANEHIDHSAVTLTFTEGIQWSSGGTDLTASATGKLDVSGLTTETTLDTTNDQLVFYDASATAHRKINVGSLVGTTLGDGRWYRNATQAFSAATEATVVFNTADYDSLTRGAFSTGTGEYTAANVTRIWIFASVTVETVDESQYNYLSIEVDGIEVARTVVVGNEDATEDVTVVCGANLNLPNGTEVVRVRLETESGQNTVAGVSQTAVSIMELV
jgi:hypothetical protein